ncbi:MAG: hypothetical protein ACRELV_07715 [Longimicrobiales bacterium]
MAKQPRSLPWVTPAKYVGPAMVVLFFVGGAVAATFLINAQFDEAIITLLFTIGFLLIGIADLLGELIMVTGREAQPPGA